MLRFGRWLTVLGLLLVSGVPGRGQALSDVANSAAQAQSGVRVLRREIRRLRSDLHRAQGELEAARRERNLLQQQASEQEREVARLQSRQFRAEMLGILLLLLLGWTWRAARSGRRGAGAGELDPLRSGIASLEGRLAAVEKDASAARRAGVSAGR